MTKGKGKRESKIKMIPIDKINILNPRVRNQKVFLDIATNMTQVGLKRPITVTPCLSGAEGKDYDLICGQGRIEAFVACGQTEIPAIVIDASEEQALIMSLVENLARRQHKGLDEEQMARMESEMESLQREYRLIEENYGKDVFNLTLAKGYLGSLLGNARIVRYLAQHHADILTQFQKIADITSLSKEAAA